MRYINLTHAYPPGLMKSALQFLSKFYLEIIHFLDILKTELEISYAGILCTYKAFKFDDVLTDCRMSNIHNAWSNNLYNC